MDQGHQISIVLDAARLRRPVRYPAKKLVL